MLFGAAERRLRLRTRTFGPDGNGGGNNWLLFPLIRLGMCQGSIDRPIQNLLQLLALGFQQGCLFGTQGRSQCSHFPQATDLNSTVAVVD